MTDTTSTPDATAEIDPQLGADYLYAREQEAFWGKRKKDAQEKLLAAVGDADVLTVGGETRFTYKRTARFKEAQFLQDHADLAEVFSHTVETTELDTAKLRRLQPALYAQYLTRSLLVVD